ARSQHRDTYRGDRYWRGCDGGHFRDSFQARSSGVVFVARRLCLWFSCDARHDLRSLPINARIATWNPTALPSNYRDFLDRWWEWQRVRLLATFAAMCLVFIAMLIRRKPSEIS